MCDTISVAEIISKKINKMLRELSLHLKNLKK